MNYQPVPRFYRLFWRLLIINFSFLTSSLLPPVQDSSSPWYQVWFDSPWYNLLYRNRDESEAIRFIDRLADYLKPLPESTILDLACGQGRHSRRLVQLGFDVTGIDLSPQNILAARARENDFLSFFEHDMRLPFRINYFQYIFNFFTSFGYFEYQRDNLQCLVSIRKGLKPSGILVIDFLNVAYAVKHLVGQEERVEEGVIFKIKREFTGRHFIKEINITDGPVQKTFTERVQGITLDQFQEYFLQAGLKLIECFGSYDLECYDPENSPRLIMIAQKPS